MLSVPSVHLSVNTLTAEPFRRSFRQKYWQWGHDEGRQRSGVFIKVWIWLVPLKILGHMLNIVCICRMVEFAWLSHERCLGSLKVIFSTSRQGMYSSYWTGFLSNQFRKVKVDFSLPYFISTNPDQGLHSLIDRLIPTDQWNDWIYHGSSCCRFLLASSYHWMPQGGPLLIIIQFSGLKKRFC